MAKTTKSKRAAGGVATVHDQKLDRGEGGELYQIASGKEAVLTTAQGGPVSDDQNSLKVGPRGPTLLEDSISARKSFTSTTNGFLSGLCMLAGTQRRVVPMLPPTNAGRTLLLHRDGMSVARLLGSPAVPRI
jgi:hypothetical protein